MVPMSWWFWILLWGALIICSLLYLAWFTYKALTRGFTLLDETVTWVESIEGQFDTAQANATRKLPRDTTLEAYNNYEQGKQERRSERIKRRVSRRDRLGQPQNIGDLL